MTDLRVPVRPGDLADWPRHVGVAELRREAQLVQVAIADEEVHSVWVPPLERHQESREAQIAGAFVDDVTSIDEVGAVVSQLECAGRVEAKHSAAPHVATEVCQVTFNIRDIANYDSCDLLLGRDLLIIVLKVRVVLVPHRSLSCPSGVPR